MTPPVAGTGAGSEAAGSDGSGSDGAGRLMAAAREPSLADGRHVVLVGLMGAGKSTVGPLLAERLNRVFLDLDQVIVDGAGRTISELFTAKGEEAFRELEHQALVDVLASRRPLVLAVGGGCAVAERNQQAMHRTATVVWLDIAPERAAARVGDDGARPLLAGDTLGSLQRLAAERNGAYRAVAHVKISAAADPGTVASKIDDKLRQAAADLGWVAEIEGASDGSFSGPSAPGGAAPDDPAADGTASNETEANGAASNETEAIERASGGRST